MSEPRPTTTVAVIVPVPDPGFVAVPPPAAAATPADMTPLERVPRATIGPGTPEPAHVVRRGDTLWDIAAAHLGSGATRAAIAEAWPRWYAANRTVIGPDPGHIEPGQRLISPSATR
ncbi:MAG: LysM peptidoglycan-binding domain-containing protein [Candidatus Phosphoribacter sp.]